MFTIDAATVISKPPSVVFAFIANPANIPKWRPEVIEVSAGATALAIGDEFDETFKLMGEKTSRMRVIESAPGRRLVIRALTGPMLRPTQTFNLNETDHGTTLTVHVDMETDPWVVVVQPLFKAMIQKLWAKYLATLKTILESA